MPIPRALVPFLLLTALLPAIAATAQETDAASTADELAELERMAEAAYVQDDLSTAIALYRQLAHRRDDVDEQTRALMTVASLEHLRGRSDRALEILGEVLRLDPDYPFRPELYAEDFAPLFYDARQRADEERGSRSAKLVAEGVNALRAGESATARAKLEQALALASNDPAALYNLALLDLREERIDAAMGGFQKVIALHDAPPEARADATEDAVTDSILAKALTNAGMIHLRQENWQDAATTLERAVELDAENRVAWTNLGQARLSLDRPSAAADALRRALRLEPDHPGTLATLASALLRAGDAVGAADLLEERVERFPDRADLWLRLGKAQRRLDRTDDAVRSLERALSLDLSLDKGSGTDAGHEANLGLQAALELAALHHRRGDAQKSLDAAQQALEWRPDSVDALVYRGLARQELGNLEGAFESLEAARKLAPERPEIHLNLGTVLYRQGRYAEAETAFARALELNPDSGAARRNLQAARQAQTTAATPPSRRAGRTSPPPPTRSPTVAESSRPAPPARSEASAGRRAARLGLVFSDIDYAALGLEGAMVEAVRGGTEAARAGLREGDLLLRLAGEKIASPADFERLLGRLPSGREVTVELLRDDRPVSLELQVP